MRVMGNKEVIVIEREVKMLICNSCGEQLDLSAMELPETNTFQQVSLRFGAGSDHDDEIWHVDLCEKCIVKMVKQFKFVPEGFKEDRMEQKIDTINPGLHQKLFEEWKVSEKWDFEYEDWFK